MAKVCWLISAAEESSLMTISRDTDFRRGSPDIMEVINPSELGIYFLLSLAVYHTATSSSGIAPR